MKLDINELIHTQVTRPSIEIEADGRGNYNLSPIGFPITDHSGSSNPTLFIPSFGMKSDATTIYTNVADLNGLQGYVDGTIIELVAQIDESENGKYVVHAGVWERYVKYTFDGTENDNKAGLYDSLDKNGAVHNHYRKGYSHEEVSDYLREKLSPSLTFGKFSGRNATNNGALFNWLSSGKSTNIGGAKTGENVFVDSFASMIRAQGSIRSSYPNDVTDQSVRDAVLDIQSRERKYSKWSLSNHHSEAAKGRNKSPFVRDYPFKYNSMYDNTIFSGGMPPLESHMDDWRISFTGVSTPSLRPMCDDALFYQQENGYHNNITIDMASGNMFGRQHISILHHLDRADVASNEIDPLGDGTQYDEYRSDLLVAELNLISNTTICGGYVLYARTVGSVTKYYYRQRAKRSITLSPYGTGTWSPTNLLWEDGSNGSVRIYLTATEYVTMSNGTHSVDWLVGVLQENNQLIPCVFTLPTDAIDANNAINELDVLFCINSLVDHSNTIHRTEKIRSKKTFIHLPTSVDMMDGQQFELDVSLPMITDQEPFKYNTLGSLSGYMNYVIQPRVYVMSGVQKCYGSTNYIQNTLKINSITKSGNTVILKSNGHGLTDVDVLVYLSGTTSIYYTGIKSAVVLDVNTITFPVNASAGDIPNGLIIDWAIRVTDISIASLTLVDGVATLMTTKQHGIIDADDVIIDIAGASDDQFNGKFRAFVSGPKTIMINMDGVDSVAVNARIMGMTIAHAKRFMHSSQVALPELDAISSNDTTVTVTYKSDITTVTGTFDLTVSGCDQETLNGEFTATVTGARVISYTIPIAYTGSATGLPVTYAYVRSGSMSGVEGLTERNNDYIYSPMPEVDGATSANVYHQHKLGNSDIASNDKRVLLATVYPTSTNTFAWRIDNDPQHKLMRHSIMATTSVYGSAAFAGYQANKTAYDKISGNLGNSAMSLYDNPMAYDDILASGTVGSMNQFIASRIRVLLPSNIIPSTDQMLTENEVKSFGSIVYQMKSAYDELLDTYYSTRVGVSNSNDGLLLNASDTVVMGYNDNGGHSGESSIPGGFRDLLKFNRVASTTATNIPRWITKAIYTSEKSLTLDGYTAYDVNDVFTNTTSIYTDYISTNCTTVDTLESNADERYIPGQLNSPAGRKYRFGVGYRNSIAAFIENVNAPISTQNDFAMAMSDWVSLIPNTSNMRTLGGRFMLNGGKQDNASISAFYGMNYTPFARLFSGDGIVPNIGKLTSLSNYTDILSGSLKSTLMGALASNPFLSRYMNLGINDAFASINTRDSNSVVQEYLRNHVVGYGTSAPIRFYNSFRIGVYGNSNSIESTQTSALQTFNYSVRDYVAEYIETLPSALHGKYIDDNFALINTMDATVGVCDPNDSSVSVRGFGVSATATITITDWTELLDSGNASIVINGVVLTAVASTPTVNQFVAGVGNIETANNLVNAINANTVGLANIVADNYGGMSSIVLLTVSQTVGAAANSYTLAFTPSSVGNTGITVVGFSGGVNAIETELNTLITVAGNPYIASKDFYTKNMRYSYIRVKMRFIFSSMCGRWLTIDYRQTPVTYMTPSIGNEAFARRDKSIVKTGQSGTNPSDYITVTESTASSVTNTDYVWKIGSDADSVHKELWCTPYTEHKSLEFNRFVLPFMANKFPYGDNGALLTRDAKQSAQSRIDLSTYRFSKLENPVSNIRMVTPNNVHGGKVVDGVDTANSLLNVFQPNLWSMYWHMRPATTAMDGCDIPSTTGRTGGSPADPTLHNMFQFPCKVNESSDPCYLIPWHEDMHYDWLMNDTSIDARIVNDVDRRDKMNIDAVFGNYDWTTGGAKIAGIAVDETRNIFIEIESDRNVN